MPARFDGYTATTKAAKPDDLLQVLSDANPGAFFGWNMTKGNGYHGFDDKWSIKDQTGSEFASILSGGRHGERCMLEVKGEMTPPVVDLLRSRYEHRATRLDSCLDQDEPGAFDRLVGICLDVKKAHRLKGSKAGDWDDYPEDGRTLYLGSTQSVCRLRLYEKGRQREYSHLSRVNWARIELQVRPAKEAKTQFSTLSADEVWGASSWTRDLAGRVFQNHVDPHPAGTIYKLTSSEAALRWMCRQYGAHLVALKDDLGSWDVVGLTLGEMIAEEAAKQRRDS